jgi:hypothetical protein
MAEALRRLALVSAGLLGALVVANGCANTGEDEGGKPRPPQPDGGTNPLPNDAGADSPNPDPDSGSHTDCPEIGNSLGRTVRVSGCPPRAGEALTVSGAGWPAQGTLDVRFCAPAIVPNVERTCPWSEEIAVAADGTFTTEFMPRSFFPVAYGATAFGSELMLDCSAAPGACTVEVREASQPEGSAIRALYAPLPDPKRRAQMDLRAPLISDLPVRFQGSGWNTSLPISAWVCGSPQELAGFPQGFRFCNGRALFESDDTGGFRLYAPVPSTFQYFAFGPAGVVDCHDMSCHWLFVDGESAAPALPLSFSESAQLDVQTKYGSTWESLLQLGVTESGRSDAEVQRIGASVLLWTMTAGAARTALKLPHDGTTTHITRYSRADYLLYTSFAAEFDYTLDELQKTGSLFWSWLLANQPPIPDDPSTIP